MKKIIFALLISIFSLPIIGTCNDATDPIDLDQYKMKASWHLKKYWYNKNNSKKLTKLKLTLNLSDSIQNQPGISLENFEHVLRDNMHTHFEKAGLQLVDENPDAVLSLNVVEMTQGDRQQRILAGEFGLGSARVYIDGYLRDAENQLVVVAFKAHQSNTGNAGLRDITHDSGPTLVKEMSEKISRDLSKELRRSMKIR